MAPSGTALDLIFQQLADLFLRSIPTVVLFLLLLAAYRLLVHRPLLKVLADRRERTTGAVARAEAAIRTADARSQEYEARLRAARAEIFHAREQRVQAMQRELNIDSAQVVTFRHCVDLGIFPVHGLVGVDGDRATLR